MATGEFRPTQPYLTIYAGNLGTSNLLLSDRQSELNTAIDTIVNIIEANGCEVDLYIRRDYPDDNDATDSFSFRAFMNRFEDEDDEEELEPELPTFRDWLQQGIDLFRKWWREMDTPPRR